jgi:predicted permease
MRLDILHLFRSLRRSPASALAAILTLSLTLGAGAAIFAVVDAVVLTPPPFANPETLVLVRETPAGDAVVSPRATTFGTFEAWRQRAGEIAQLEAMDGTNLTMTGLGAAERVSATDVTPGFLSLLGVSPAAGRTFDTGDIAQPVVIVSHAFWTSRLGGDPGVVGRQIVLGSRPHTIVGILPEKFTFTLSSGDLWRPLPVTVATAVRTGYRVSALARLGPRATAADLGAALDNVSGAAIPPLRTVVTPVASAVAGDAPKMLALLAGAAAVAMIIALTNLAGLLLVRAIDRRRELAVRTALGAGRGAIVRQLLLEAQVMVILGAAGGALLALWLTPAVAGLFGGVGQSGIAVNWRGIIFISLAASACAALCVLLPSAVSARSGVVDVLRRGVTAPPRDRRLRRVFVTAQIALAFVLLVSVTFLARGWMTLLRTPAGFDADGVMVTSVSLPGARYPTAERVATFYATLHDSLRQRLGDRAVAIIDELPVTGDRGRLAVAERPGEPRGEAVIRSASRDYFEVMRIPIAAGRSFDASDNAAAPPRVVVSTLIAQRLFGAGPAVGRHIWLGAGTQPAEIVGVAGEVKHGALDGPPTATVYLPSLQVPSQSTRIVVRNQRPDGDVISEVRSAVAQLDPDLPVYSTRSMSDIVATSPGIPVRRVLTAAFTGFAVIALVVGALGLFGVAAHDVATRRAELALRIALGANPRRILMGTLRQGALVVGAGLLAGGLLSIWTSRALGALVASSARFDMAGIALPALVILITGIAAVLPAALRAARTDPLAALRSE